MWDKGKKTVLESAGTRDRWKGQAPIGATEVVVATDCHNLANNLDLNSTQLLVAFPAGVICQSQKYVFFPQQKKRDSEVHALVVSHICVHALNNEHGSS